MKWKDQVIRLYRTCFNAVCIFYFFLFKEICKVHECFFPVYDASTSFHCIYTVCDLCGCKFSSVVIHLKCWCCNHLVEISMFVLWYFRVGGQGFMPRCGQINLSCWAKSIFKKKNNNNEGIENFYLHSLNFKILLMVHVYFCVSWWSSKFGLLVYKFAGNWFQKLLVDLRYSNFLLRFVVYISTLCDDATLGKKSLRAALDSIFSTSVSEAAESSSLNGSESTDVKPILLWTASYIQETITVCFSSLASVLVFFNLFYVNDCLN